MRFLEGGLEGVGKVGEKRSEGGREKCGDGEEVRGIPGAMGWGIVPSTKL